MKLKEWKCNKLKNRINNCNENYKNWIVLRNKTNKKRNKYNKLLKGFNNNTKKLNEDHKVS